jgi:hypothetical protein
MWILFGTHYNTVENEPYVYFIGAFDDLDAATIEKKKLLLETKCSVNDFFIKKVEIGEVYTHGWSNSCDI